MYSIVMLLEGVDSFEPLLATSKGALAELPQSVKDICGSVASAPWCNAPALVGVQNVRAVDSVMLRNCLSANLVPNLTFLVALQMVYHTVEVLWHSAQTATPSFLETFPQDIIANFCRLLV